MELAGGAPASRSGIWPGPRQPRRLACSSGGRRGPSPAPFETTGDIVGFAGVGRGRLCCWCPSADAAGFVLGVRDRGRGGGRFPREVRGRGRAGRRRPPRSAYPRPPAQAAAAGREHRAYGGRAVVGLGGLAPAASSPGAAGRYTIGAAPWKARSLSAGRSARRWRQQRRDRSPVAAEISHRLLRMALSCGDWPESAARSAAGSASRSWSNRGSSSSPSASWCRASSFCRCTGAVSRSQWTPVSTRPLGPSDDPPGPMLDHFAPLRRPAGPARPKCRRIY
jgi:hypothetical protein